MWRVWGHNHQSQARGRHTPPKHTARCALSPHLHSSSCTVSLSRRSRPSRFWPPQCKWGHTAIKATLTEPEGERGSDLKSISEEVFDDPTVKNEITLAWAKAYEDHPPDTHGHAKPYHLAKTATIKIARHATKVLKKKGRAHSKSSKA